ncbi:hypothetical protein MY8738_005408 [Beauveria namnaoensis]
MALAPDEVWNHEDEDEGDTIVENSREFGVCISLGQHAKCGRYVDSEEPQAKGFKACKRTQKNSRDGKAQSKIGFQCGFFHGVERK